MPRSQPTISELVLDPAQAPVLPNDTLDATRFLTHRVDVAALDAGLREIGRTLAIDQPGTAILTAEHGGIAPSILLGREIGADVVIALKSVPSTLEGHTLRSRTVSSFTHRRVERLHISQECCAGVTRAHVVDDFLSTGSTASALGRLARDLGVDVLSFVFVVNKTYLGGEAALREAFTAPVHAVVSLDAPVAGNTGARRPGR
jgi:adenine/guanine phosphoribosyltransferase-like PRPP-binding protein